MKKEVTPSSNLIRSSISKGLVIFLVVMLVLTDIFIVLIAIFERASAFAILGYIMCGAFNLIALFLLISTLFDYVIVKDDYIIKKTLGVKRKAKINKITKIVHQSNFYAIYIGDAVFTHLNDRDPETTKMLLHFEKMGFDIGKIQQ